MTSLDLTANRADLAIDRRTVFDVHGLLSAGLLAFYERGQPAATESLTHPLQDSVDDLGRNAEIRRVHP